MPGKSRTTGNKTTDSGYNKSSSQAKSNTQSYLSSRECKRLLTLSRFSFLEHLTSFSSLLLQRMTRAALFYDEEGKQVFIFLQGDHLNLSHCSLQYDWLLRYSFEETSFACQPVKKGCPNRRKDTILAMLQKPRHVVSSYLLSGYLALSLSSERFFRLDA